MSRCTHSAWNGQRLKPESSPSAHDLEQQLCRLRELAASLENARMAVLHSDLAELTQQTVRQRELCAAIGRLDPDILSCPAEHRRTLLQESVQVAVQVARLNREYGALLSRARRTVDIFCRVLANSEATYLPPKREAASVSTRVEG